MSTDTERVDEGVLPAALQTWRDWYHLPALGLVVAFMLWVRLQARDRFVTGDGTPAFAGIDSWYHWRAINWTVENYPHTMPYEVWTGFPEGHYSGQFGTLFDQLIATAAMIVGLGNPSQETVYAVALVATPVMGALVAIPVFYMGRRLGGTVGGFAAAAIVALAPGTFLARSTTGQLDHHVAEVLFMAIAVLATMVALRVGEREKPIYELVVERDWDAIREPAIYSVLAGIALALYIWVWPPAVLLVGILGVFYTVALCLDYVRGVSPDHVAFVGAVSLGVTAIFTLLLVEDGASAMGTTNFGFLQPALAALVAIGCVFMAWLARQWNARDLERTHYPVAIAGLLVVAVAATAVLVPDVYGTIVNNLTGRLLPLDIGDTTLTVQEAQPPDNFRQHVQNEFGPAAFYTMLAGLAILIARPLVGREYRAEYALMVVWTLFLIGMAMTQSRFAYYLVLPVAVLSAAFVGEAIRAFGFDRAVDSLRDLETYQVIALVLVALLLFVPLLPPVANTTAIDTGSATGPNGNAMEWQEANHWLDANTPDPTAQGDASLDYYGTYDAPADDDFDYPEGAYGVLSWWDYGHLITTQGERVPHANPFQQNARSASAYLTAQSEERGETILEAISAGVFETGMTTEELQAAINGTEEAERDESVDYVMIDHQMAGGKFNPITAWTGPGYGSYLDRDEFALGNQSASLTTSGEAYEDTMVGTLYRDDATGLEHYRLVHETSEYAIVGNLGQPTQDGGLQGVPLQSFAPGGFDEWNNQTAYYQQTLQNESALHPYPDPAVTGQTPQAYLYDADVAATVKTFERVAGATIEGTVDDEAVATDGNATVTASVTLESAPGRPFQYSQRANLSDDGSFEVTVPYATNDPLGPEDGVADSSVEATGDYRIQVVSPDAGSVYAGNTSVPETAVVDGETVDVSVEELEIDSGEGNESDGGNETDGGTNATDASESVGPIARAA